MSTLAANNVFYASYPCTTAGAYDKMLSLPYDDAKVLRGAINQW